MYIILIRAWALQATGGCVAVAVGVGNNNNNTCVSAMRKTSIKIHKLLLMRIELSDMRMGTATPSILTLYPTRLKNYACHAFSLPLLGVWFRNLCKKCFKSLQKNFRLRHFSVNKIGNFQPNTPFPCLRPYSGHAHKNARQLKNEAAVGDICYLLRFVYITLYLESAMPEQCQAKPSAGSPSSLPPLPFRPLSSAALCHWFTYFSYTCRQHFNMCLCCVRGRGMSTGETRCRKSQTAEKKKGEGGAFLQHTWLKYFNIYVYWPD